MGGVVVPCLRAAKSRGRNQGWLLMSFTPPARQPYRLLRSTWGRAERVELQAGMSNGRCLEGYMA